MSSPIKVVIAGINGRMGKATLRLIEEDPTLELVGCFGRPGAPYVGEDAGKLTNSAPTGILVSNDFESLPEGIQPDVLLDYSPLSSLAVENAKRAIQKGIRPVIGTSGFGEKEINAVKEPANKDKVGAMIVPNFSIGAVLMIEFAKQAGAFFENVEIVEMHHTKKLDAPSGTAMFTTRKLAENNKNYNVTEVEEHELLKNARGGQTDRGVRVHSLRLPGLVSHQEVIFGAPGELLTVRHDSFNMDCFLKGIRMSVDAVLKLDHLVVGLDKILNLNGTQEREKIGGRAG